jgi:hypothetical protein
MTVLVHLHRVAILLEHLREPIAAFMHVVQTGHGGWRCNRYPLGDLLLSGFLCLVHETHVAEA